MSQQTRSPSVLGGAIVAAALLVGAGLTDARAQQQQQPVPEQQQPAMPSEFSQGQIETFADAALEVQQVQQNLNAEIQNVQDAQELERLQQEAQQEAQQAVEDKGLSLEEYDAILQAANQDPQLYAMILEVMEQKAQ